MESENQNLTDSFNKAAFRKQLELLNNLNDLDFAVEEVIAVTKTHLESTAHAVIGSYYEKHFPDWRIFHNDALQGTRICENCKNLTAKLKHKTNLTYIAIGLLGVQGIIWIGLALKWLL
jgi:hypothetical protein